MGYNLRMQTQQELRAEFRRLFEADMCDEAEAILDQMEPVSEEEFQKMLDAAPYDDEPLDDQSRRRFENFERALGLRAFATQ